MDKYAVVGNPIAHSKSPQIHTAFARATRQDLTYERLLAPLDGFETAVESFAREGGRGLNVTVPFKLEALSLAREVSDRARAAGAANTLKRVVGGWFADNTDGAGIVRDLTANLGVVLAGRDLLLLGAGGAARGVLAPLFAQEPRSVTILNRTAARGAALADAFASRGPVTAGTLDTIAGHQFDLVINATSAGLSGEAKLPWPRKLFRRGAFAYDMIYSDAPTVFLHWAREQGVERLADGLGMLIEQAAESFFLWRGVRPDTRAVFTLLRPGA